MFWNVTIILIIGIIIKHDWMKMLTFYFDDFAENY